MGCIQLDGFALLAGRNSGTTSLHHVFMAREIISSFMMIAPFVAPLEDVLAWQGENMQCPPEDGLEIAGPIGICCG